jgi:hypothetical protein
MKESNGKLVMRSVPVHRLDSETIEGMWQLYSANYDQVTRANFDRDFKKKGFVFVGRDKGSGAFAGFSTAEIYFSTKASVSEWSTRETR